MGKRALPFALVLIIGGLVPGFLRAQVDYSTATLKGTVFDPQGLAVAGATVNVTNPGTGWSRVLRTGDQGTYFVPVLPPGALQDKRTSSGIRQHHGPGNRVGRRDS